MTLALLTVRELGYKQSHLFFFKFGTASSKMYFTNDF